MDTDPYGLRRQFDKKQRKLGDDLSKRQITVIACIALGMKNSVISQVLGISEKSVKNHLWLSSQKLLTCCRVDSVLCAIRLGIIPLDEDELKALVEKLK